MMAKSKSTGWLSSVIGRRTSWAMFSPSTMETTETSSTSKIASASAKAPNINLAMPLKKLCYPQQSGKR